MKQTKQFFLIALIFLSLTALTFQGDEPKYGMGEVSQMNGIELYIMAEPVREYKVVIEPGKILSSSTMTPSAKKLNPAEKADELTKMALSKATKEGVQIDAVIYSNANWIAGIQYTDKETTKTKGTSMVSKIEGLDVYVFSEPLVEYEIISSNAKTNGSGVFTGTMCNSIEEDLTKLIHKAKKAVKPRTADLDAVIYTAGKSVVGISYRKN